MNIFTIEFFGAAIGLVYIFLEYRASWWLWIAGIVMSWFYIYIFAKANCYAWAFTYLYYFGANIYGIIAWKRNKSGSSQSGITTLPKKYYPIVSIIAILFTLILFFILKKYTNTLIPVSESLSTALSIIGMWLLAKKYLQHWIMWMIVNTIYAIANLWLELYFSAVLFTVYFIVSVMGYIRWCKLAEYKPYTERKELD